MTEQGPDADVPALELRPLGWREAGGAARLWRDLLVLAFPLVPAVVVPMLLGRQHPVVVVLALACVLLTLVVYTVELVLVRHERVVVTWQAVEWWRGRRLRARVNRGPPLHAARYVPWPFGRPLALIHLAISDGTTGFRLGDVRWIGQFQTILLSAGVDAPRLTQERARHRMPECFTPIERLADLVGSRRRRVAVLVTVLVLAVVAFLVGLVSGGGA